MSTNQELSHYASLIARKRWEKLNTEQRSKATEKARAASIAAAAARRAARESGGTEND